jgi:hypothetical protein
MTGLTTYDSNGSSNSLLVTINPAAGLWDILSGQTKWTWMAIKEETGPNNTKVMIPVAGDQISNDLATYVSSNKQSFSIDSIDILEIIKENMNDDIEFNKISLVESKISLLAFSADPNNLTPMVSLPFTFNIKII